MIKDVHDALCFALWHHQGGSSTIGQPIRKMLDLGPHDHMDKDEIAGAKRVQSALKTQRTWVGLTNEDKCTVELAQAGVELDWIDGYKSGLKDAEEKLKEKNT